MFSLGRENKCEMEINNASGKQRYVVQKKNPFTGLEVHTTLCVQWWWSWWWWWRFDHKLDGKPQPLRRLRMVIRSLSKRLFSSLWFRLFAVRFDTVGIGSYRTAVDRIQSYRCPVLSDGFLDSTPPHLRPSHPDAWLCFFAYTSSVSASGAIIEPYSKQPGVQR